MVKPRGKSGGLDCRYGRHNHTSLPRVSACLPMGMWGIPLGSPQVSGAALRSTSSATRRIRLK